jgi:hypothetical protein
VRVSAIAENCSARSPDFSSFTLADAGGRQNSNKYGDGVNRTRQKKRYAKEFQKAGLSSLTVAKLM